MDELRSHNAYTAVFHKLLDLIQQEMLIVQKGEPDGLIVPGQERARRRSSGNIARDLGSIKINCESINGYIAPATNPPGD